MPRLAHTSRVWSLVKGPALIGVEFGGPAAAAQGFLEGLMEGLGVGPRVISRIGDQA